MVGSRDAAATRAAWVAAGASPDEVKALGRLLEGEGGPLELRFRNVMLPRTETGGLGLFACEHLTPAPMRRPAWLAHPNGAKAIRSCTVVASQTAPLVAAMTRLFGSAAITRTDNVVAAHTGHGVIVIAPPEDAELVHPLLDLPGALDEPPGGSDAGGGRPGADGGIPPAARGAVRKVACRRRARASGRGARRGPRVRPRLNC